MSDQASSEKHKARAEEASRLYTERVSADPGREIWAEAVKESRGLVFETLRASNNLTNIERSLRDSGRHMLVYRHLTAPPLSQDQFRLTCPTWSKGTEKSGAGLSSDKARVCAEKVRSFFDAGLVPWLSKGRPAERWEVRRLVHTASVLIARQRFETVRRNRMAAAQEQRMLAVLGSLGWSELPSRLIDTRADLPARTYMHKTRFATKTRPQEVDVACGLGRSVVLATECKVTNDETNSVKRVNDVLKKASAWKEHWGSFVRPAALLEGVIKHNDVDRLLHAGVEVFWSHRIDELRAWLEQNVSED